MKRNRKKYMREYQRKYYRTPDGNRRTKEIQTKSRRRYRYKLFTEYMEKYGNICACCGESERRFLTVAHINNDGVKHRERVGHSGVISDLKQRGWPKDEGMATQCWNCNEATRFGKECPHKRKKEPC